jgi:hypothetical protein
MNGPYTIYRQKIVRMLDDAYETRTRLDYLGQNPHLLSDEAVTRILSAKTFNECLIDELDLLYADLQHGGRGEMGTL